jgi:hypothetical protein
MKIKEIKLGQAITIFANLGVIAGIVFLGVELQQNNELLEAQARYNHKETRANYLGEFEDNPGLAIISAKANNGEALSAEEQIQWDSYHDRLFVNWEWEFYEASTRRFELPIEGFKWSMTQPDVAQRWQDRKQLFSEDFRAFMQDTVIEQ